MNIKKINDPKFDFDGYDQFNFDSWEMFDYIHDTTQDEKDFAIKFLDKVGIDIEDEEIITFNAQPHHLANIVVHIIRQYKSRNI